MSKEGLRFIPTDSHKRDAGKDFTDEAIARQVAEFESRGGKPQIIEFGVSTIDFTKNKPVNQKQGGRGVTIELPAARKRRISAEAGE